MLNSKRFRKARSDWREKGMKEKRKHLKIPTVKSIFSDYMIEVLNRPQSAKVELDDEEKTEQTREKDKRGDI